MQANKRSVLRGQQAHGATAAERTARHTANAALLEAFRVLRALFHQQPAVQSMQDKVYIAISAPMCGCGENVSLRRAGVLASRGAVRRAQTLKGRRRSQAHIVAFLSVRFHLQLHRSARLTILP